MAFFHANLPSRGRGRGGIVSRCAMEWRVADALAPIIQHRHRPSDRRMLRDHARCNEEASVPFVGAERRTGSGIMLQSLLFRLPRLQERVANAVTFPTRYRGSHSSIPLENGEGVPVSGTYAPATGTHRSNRWACMAPCSRGIPARVGSVPILARAAASAAPPAPATVADACASQLMEKTLVGGWACTRRGLVPATVCVAPGEEPKRRNQRAARDSRS